MIPTLEEWLENRQFEGYKFGPPIFFDGGTQVAIALSLPDGRCHAARARTLDYDNDRAVAVRFMKQQLVFWAKSKGY